MISRLVVATPERPVPRRMDGMRRVDGIGTAASLASGPVLGKAYRVEKGGLVLGCLSALAKAPVYTSGWAMVCRQLPQGQTSDAAALAMARRIAREDFPSINP
ncbi:hypothetical protein [Roseospira visakhapatnamensis]|uniref:Uncharacterized protein n=1 Tax=Roseospira visakhapatnamensis TaxID=390880 RepID=A0A7W6RDG1_9PROT|nr:hypothetical protein [Roseospira visakhapatnamensis]MBB4266292.1 hypothetical protein [Roseospira visakhapatnamensis]